LLPASFENYPWVTRAATPGDFVKHPDINRLNFVFPYAPYAPWRETSSFFRFYFLPRRQGAKKEAKRNLLSIKFNQTCFDISLLPLRLSGKLLLG
jgi:hypothetical protein